jgi:hypothetical protein
VDSFLEATHGAPRGNPERAVDPMNPHSGSKRTDSGKKANVDSAHARIVAMPLERAAIHVSHPSNDERVGDGCGDGRQGPLS